MTLNGSSHGAIHFCCKEKHTHLIYYVTSCAHKTIIYLVLVLLCVDNFFGQVNITRNGTEELMRPKVGMYNMKSLTWYVIIGGIVVSLFTYFIINQYWIWQPLHYTGDQTSGFVPQNSLIKSMTDADKYVIFAFDLAAWVAMVLLLASFIVFCVFASGNESISELPGWVYTTHILSYILMCFSFFFANIQTVGFGLCIFTQPCCWCVVLLQCFHRPQYRVH